VDKDALLISVMASAQAQEITVTAPGKWSAAGGKIKETKNGVLVLIVPAGTTSVRLTR
jgi:hypothetical protein